MLVFWEISVVLELKLLYRCWLKLLFIWVSIMEICVFFMFNSVVMVLCREVGVWIGLLSLALLVVILV